MKFPSLEELAERWTVSHTIAVAAWVVVVALGLMLLFRQTGSPYPTTGRLKVYAGENATFKYPENWQLSRCVLDRPFIELPGSFKADYKGQKAYALNIYATGAYNCIKDRPERFDIYSEDIVASDTPCAIASSTEGERLKNGLYLQLQEHDGELSAVYVKQNSCFAPADTAVISFSLVDPEAKPGDEAKFGQPRVNKDDFLASRQYQDIKALAESIRY